PDALNAYPNENWAVGATSDDIRPIPRHWDLAKSAKCINGVWSTDMGQQPRRKQRVHREPHHKCRKIRHSPAAALGSYAPRWVILFHTRAEFRLDRVLSYVEEPEGEGKKGGGHVEQPRDRGVSIDYL